MPFDTDFIRFKIVDKKVAKRTAIQETVIDPVRSYNEILVIGGKSTIRTVYTVPQFTIPDDKILVIELVEKNLHVPGYSVEQLSRDLCMERTGLYRKLVAMLDQSPSLFIRNIRLQRAAQLILEGSLSITEIAERTGFSSSSYLSKCFQEMYGCRPSEYTEKAKKST
mgnify:CR=1 FL=1